MALKEYEILLKVKVEARSLEVANTIANGIVDDLLLTGEQYIDRPINHVQWSRISPVFKKPLADAIAGALDAAHPRSDCPGCIDCGPPIVVKAEDACGRAK